MRKAQVATRLLARREHCNPSGDVGGWFLMSEADVVGSILATRLVCGRVVTRAVKTFEFIRPSYEGNILSFYTWIEKLGNTSVTIKVEIYAEDIIKKTEHHVATASIVYVSVDEDGKPKHISTVGTF